MFSSRLSIRLCRHRRGNCPQTPPCYFFIYGYESPIALTHGYGCHL